ncbi:hypothetical protein A2865_04785 [Candidatus Woesebacteria bacterium RIFCSPHIGHO2_01_FULL_39_17]|uniref:Uncharacterized protein n=3 Tax=Candidatus Woeseibacteriota TaxID=1752722 RepID=A0A0G0NKT0_9BACT|nr:MAG: hypothetical protein US72_C0001G0113 [Microgenomates group bacterium GW2011_GWC1_38_12]KKQ93692.1 MAG: hypothetical protein UT19_C0008G0017 [Candidatus Woesebacteria bacterium GW2011_GWB1_39_10b]KKR13436.1 MAG: hypothetical protein UT40_C0017G0022 [Candidatus Woesebacteria bacterium GW2011_GWA1_39_21b]OGM23032.1 MAG: hypothetical protein A2865_04785 [Candidatus Woesebacteria bacterium RIFCSPHIGHO2_01_FULL_39_17]OGM63524.1 MAG: hypothetical protein A3A52_01315 [Candidatus Woesebacteria b
MTEKEVNYASKDILHSIKKVLKSSTNIAEEIKSAKLDEIKHDIEMTEAIQRGALSGELLARKRSYHLQKKLKLLSIFRKLFSTR